MALALGGITMLARAAPPLVEVWKSRDCGCCKEWVKHLEAQGFQVETHDTGNIDARTRLGMPVKYGACHTAQAAGYALEGHVPARDVLRLLTEKPDAVGPAFRGQRDPFDVLLVLRDGSANSHQSHR